MNQKFALNIYGIFKLSSTSILHNYQTQQLPHDLLSRTAGESYINDGRGDCKIRQVSTIKNSNYHHQQWQLSEIPQVILTYFYIIIWFNLMKCPECNKDHSVIKAGLRDTNRGAIQRFYR